MSGVRNPNIDLIKTVAMLLVVLAHTSTVNQAVYGVYYRACVVTVPLFLMVAGWLLIPKPNLDWAYVWRKVKAIVRVMAIGFVIIYVFRGVVDGWDVPMRQVPWHMLGQFVLSFVHLDDYTVLWFFGVLIIMYMLAPWLGRLYRERPRAYAWVFAGATALLLAVFVLNHMPEGSGPWHKHPFEENVPQTLRVWNWLFYFTLGGMLRRPGVVEALKPWCTPMAVAALLLANELAMTKLHDALNGSLFVQHNYTCPVAPLLCTVLFVWLLKLPLPRPCKPLQVLAPLFVPVYVFHIEVVFYFLSRIESLIGVWIVSAVVSVALSWVAMRIPLVRRAFTI